MDIMQGFAKLPSLAPSRTLFVVFFLFAKRSKSRSSASQIEDRFLPPNLGEADPGGLGACPQ
jgi:hypothetical protein